MPRICFNLTFDPATEQAIRTLWSRLADAGIFVRGLSGYPPHITLTVYDVERVDPYENVLTPMASDLAPFPILLESLGIFPENGVLFLAPRMSETLFTLHRTTIQAFMNMGKADQPSPTDDLLLPNFWTPHATLAGSLTSQQMLQALEICLRHWAPIRGQATGIGMRIFPEPTAHRYYAFKGLQP